MQYCVKCGTPTSWQPAPPQNPPPPPGPPPPGALPPSPPPPGTPSGYQAPQSYQTGQPLISNYLIWSIITTICCCLPLGIYAIIKSSEVNTKLGTGDFTGAKDASDLSKKLNIIGMIVGGIGQAIYLAVMIFAAIAGEL